MRFVYVTRRSVGGTVRLGGLPGLFVQPPLLGSGARRDVLFVPEDSVVELSSGIRVVADGGKEGGPCAIGVWLGRGGFQDEDVSAGETGAASVLSRLAMFGSANETWERLGGLHVSASRDGMIFATTVMHSQLTDALKALKEAVFQIEYTDSGLLGRAAASLAFERRNTTLNCPDVLLRELISFRIFGGHGLGNTLWNIPETEEGLALPSTKMLGTFYKRALSNVVIGGVGISASSLADIANKIFDSNIDFVREDRNDAGICPGPLFVEDAELGVSTALAEANPYSNLTHFVVGFPCLPGWHISAASQAVAAGILGGGASFSAGGPGKGLYSRLYMRVLNRFAWMENSFAEMGSHASAGWFGIRAAARCSFERRAVGSVVEQMCRLTEHLDQTELLRAKNRVKSQLLMAIESRLAHLEHLVRSVSIYGGPVPRAHVLAALDAVSTSDLKTFLGHLLSSPPSVVAVGENLSAFPSYPEIIDAVESERRRLGLDPLRYS